MVHRLYCRAARRYPRRSNRRSSRGRSLVRAGWRHLVPGDHVSRTTAASSRASISTALGKFVRPSLARAPCRRPIRFGRASSGHRGGALQRPSMRGRVVFGTWSPGTRCGALGAKRGDVLETSADLTVAGTGRAGRQVQPVDHPLADRHGSSSSTRHRAVGHRLRRAIRPRPARHAGGTLRQPMEQFTIAIEPKGTGGVFEAGVGEDTRVDPVLGEIALHLDFAVVADYASSTRRATVRAGDLQHIWVQQFPACTRACTWYSGSREAHRDRRAPGADPPSGRAGHGGPGRQRCLNFAEPPAGVTDIEAGAILVFDVPFPHAGAYRFEITMDGDMKASCR